MNKSLPQAYFEGQIVPFEQANISVATHALHYGTAAFGGLRARPDSSRPGSMTLFRPDLHAARLSESARLLGYKLSSEKITDALAKFIAANPADEAYYIRPLVYASSLDIVPSLHNMTYDLLIYGLKMGSYLSNQSGISCCFSSWSRGEDRSMPLRGKISGIYVTSALAKSEAINRGFDEAILFNNKGKVAEGSAMNIFKVRGGVLVTPSVSEDILEGITRRSIIELARDLGLEVVERAIDRSELLIASEVFLTGTAAQIAPVGRIEQYTLPQNHPVTDKLQAALTDILTARTDFHRDWVVSFQSSAN